MADRKKIVLELEDLPRAQAAALMAEQAEGALGGFSSVWRLQDPQGQRETDAAPDNPPPGLLAKIQIAT